MDRSSARPRQYSDEYASSFQNRSVAEAYEYRPPYPAETYEILLDLLKGSDGKVLDVGCGPGKIARSLVPHVDAVDAVDFSDEMIRVGKSLNNGNHPHLEWIHGRVEDVPLNPPYDMVTAGASVHWMDWSVVFPRFKQMITPGGHLVIISGDHPVETPWRDAERTLIGRYSTNRDYKEIDLIRELVERKHLRVVGDKRTEPVCHSQPIDEYIASFHSRQSLTAERMGEKNLQAFDAALSRVLSGFADKDQMLKFQLQTRIVWGKPLT